ncbi:hypothetical protein DPEC_G00242730 [Dallia pectoralis]|uniref:Uncharacterized protein n=1 Tax=Dallia pectoralis TaxID=75939 RepID=A0ACC2FV85_DALPE|nr:hypothetical protein DPEC_G00242730 [Dallia pectoralis]
MGLREGVGRGEDGGVGLQVAGCRGAGSGPVINEDGRLSAGGTGRTRHTGVNITERPQTPLMLYQEWAEYDDTNDRLMAARLHAAHLGHQVWLIISLETVECQCQADAHASLPTLRVMSSPWDIVPAHLWFTGTRSGSSVTGFMPWSVPSASDGLS